MNFSPRTFCLALLSFLIQINLLAAAEPVRLVPYPQKVCTVYPLDSPAVPAALRSNSIALPVGNITAAVRASDGAIWLGTAQGLVRLDFSAAERDRRQFMAGKRYLRDDRVEQLLPGHDAGVWVRTPT